MAELPQFVERHAALAAMKWKGGLEGVSIFPKITVIGLAMIRVFDAGSLTAGTDRRTVAVRRPCFECQGFTRTDPSKTCCAITWN